MSDLVEAAEGPTLDTREALVVETLGLPLTAYLCATDEDSILQRLEGRAELAPSAERTLIQELVPFAQVVAARAASEPGLPVSYALQALAQPSPGGGESIGNVIRRQSGGEPFDDLLEATHGDPVEQALARMAIDCYPVLLAPAESRWRMPIPTLFGHPLRGNLQEAVQADPALNLLFPNEDPGLGRSGFIFTSLGRGGGVQDVMFGEMVIGSAWRAVTMLGTNRTPAALVERVHENLETLRRAARGETVTVAALIVFTGFRTHEDAALDTTWGQLRPLTEAERAQGPPVSEGNLSTTTPDGQQVVVSYAGETVLEVQIPYAIKVGPPPDANAQGFRFPSIRGADTLRRTIEGTQLALLLATERMPGNWATARLVWTWMADPFGHGDAFGWSDTKAMPGFVPVQLSPDECADVSKWAERVHEGWTPRIDIAVRRFLSAANSRTDMADRLVDSVVVWENLLGTTQGEQRFRISSAMAWLLTDNAADRQALQKRLKELYDARSKIVHGGAPDEATLSDQANAALGYARDALRTLLADRLDVLSLADGAERSLRLVMGYDPPNERDV